MAFFQGYLAQGTGGPNGFVENTLGGYSRQPITMAPLTNGNTSLAAPVTFQVTNSVTVTQRALYDASTGGNLIMWWNLDNVVSAQAGGVDAIRVGALSHTFPDLYGGMGNGSAAVDFLNGRKIGTTALGNYIYAGHFIEVTNGTVAAKSSV